jgi:hypothetical protein
LGELFAHHDPVVLPFDAPARNRIEGRWTHRFPGAQAETGMMPGATHGAVNDDAVG